MYIDVHDQKDVPILRERCRAIHISLVPSEMVTVKMWKYEQDKENADFSQGAYLDVRDQEKTQVRRCIATYIRAFTV